MNSRARSCMAAIWVTFLFTTTLALFAPEASAQTDTAWIRRFSGPGSGNDAPRRIQVDALGNVIVAGLLWAGDSARNDLAVIKYDASGTLLWERHYGSTSTSYEDELAALAVGASGNVYLCGSSFESATGYDFVTIKYDPMGDQTWIRRYPALGGGWDEAHDLALDSSGNVYVTGSSDQNCVTVKYDSDGNLIWDRAYGSSSMSPDISSGRAIDIDRHGNVVVAGYVGGGRCDYDYLALKYDTAGALLWSRSYDYSMCDDWVRDVKTDDAGNVYVTGENVHYWTVDLLDVPGMLTVKYDAEGQLLWSRFLGTGTRAFTLGIDKLGNAYVAGYASSDDSTTDFVTVKYDSLGDAVWERRYDGAAHLSDVAYNLTLDTAGRVYVTGVCTEAGPLQNYLSLCYRPDGSLKWLRRYAGALTGAAAYDIAVDTSGYVYVTGSSDWGASGDDWVTIKYTPYQCDCPCHADPQCDGAPNVQDVLRTVNVVFRGATPIDDSQCPEERTDVDCDGYTTVRDVVKVVDVAFRGANPATEFCDPCL